MMISGENMEIFLYQVRVEHHYHD